MTGGEGSAPASPRPRTRRWRRVRTVVGWLIGAALLALCAAWLAAGSAFVVDLAANLTAQSAMAGVAFGAWSLARRKWARAGLMFGAVALALAGIVPGRAMRAGPPSEGEVVVRVLTMNAYAWNRQPEGLERLLLEVDADVVTLFEPPSEMLEFIRSSEALRAKYPSFELPERAEAGYRLALSRWPMERVRRRDVPREVEEAEQWRLHGRTWRVDGPRAFYVTMIHPESPRTEVRWRQGNEDCRSAAAWISRTLGPFGLPVIAAGDFNSTPSGWRSRYLVREGGLRRAKPWWKPAGTWPAWSVWPARIALDDVMTTPEWAVRSWTLMPPPPIGRKGVSGSDHVPVLVELVLR